MRIKRKVSWESFHELTKILVTKIPQDLQKLPMLTIGRGGVILSGVLQYALDNRTNQILTLETYTKSDTLGERIKTHGGGLLALHPAMLLIDDLVDTGTTIEHVLNRYPATQFTLLTLFKKAKARDLDVPHYFAAHAAANCWLEMPWD